MGSSSSRKAISSFLLFTFSILNIPSYAIAADTNTLPPSFDKAQSESGISVSQFNTLNQSQQDAVAFKNALTAAQAQTQPPSGSAEPPLKGTLAQPPTNGSLSKTAPIQAYYHDGVILQTLAGADFLRLKADGSVAGRTLDRSSITDIALDSTGRILSYTRSRAETIEGISLSITQKVSNITYLSSNDPSADITNNYSITNNKNNLTLEDIQFDTAGRITSYKVTTNKAFGSNSFKITKTLRQKYNRYGEVIFHRYDTTTTPLSTNPDTKYDNIIVDGSLNLRSFVKEVTQTINGIAFRAIQIASSGFTPPTGPPPLDMPYSKAKGTTDDGRAITNVTVNDDGLVGGYKQARVVGTTTAATIVNEEDVAVDYSKPEGPTTTTTKSETTGTTADGGKITNVTTGEGGRIEEYTSTKTQPFGNDVTFKTNNRVKVTYDETGNKTESIVSSEVTGTTSDGRTISNITVDPQGLVTGYKESRTQTFLGIAFTSERTVSAQDTGVVTTTPSAPSWVTVSNIQTDSSLQVTSFTKMASQSIDGISFASQWQFAVPSIVSSSITGTASDGRVISDISLNQEGLITGYKEARSQNLAGIQFDFERTASNITYDANGDIQNKDTGNILSNYLAPAGITISDIQTDNLLRLISFVTSDGRIITDIATYSDGRVSGYIERRPDQSLNEIEFATSRVATLTYDQQGNATTTWGNIQVEGKTSDGRAISEITLGATGLVTGYKETRTQTLTNITFSLGRTISDITYDASGNFLNQNEGSVSSTYTPSGVTLGLELSVEELKTDSLLRVKSFERSVIQSLNDIRFWTWQNLNISYSPQGDATISVADGIKVGTASDGRFISEITLNQNDFVISYKESRLQTISSILFDLKRLISDIAYDASGKPISQNDDFSYSIVPIIIMLDGKISVADVEVDSLLRVTKHATMIEQTLPNGVTFTTERPYVVTYDQSGGATASLISQTIRASDTTLSNVTLDSQSRVISYDQRKTQVINGITFIIDRSYIVAYDPSANVTLAREAITPSDATATNITLDSKDRVASYKQRKTQTLNSIAFTIDAYFSIKYDSQNNPTATIDSAKSTKTGITTDGRTIADITLNQNGLVASYREGRRQTLSLFLFDLEKTVSKITYDSNGAFVSQQEAFSPLVRPSITVVGASMRVSDVQADSLLRVTSFTNTITQSLDNIAFKTTQVSSVSYDQQGMASITASAAQTIATPPDGRAISDITLDQYNRVIGYAERRAQTINGISFDTLRNASVSYAKGYAEITGQYQALSVIPPANDLIITDVTYASNGLISGYKESRAQDIARYVIKTDLNGDGDYSDPGETQATSASYNITFNLERVISDITYDVNKNKTGQTTGPAIATYNAPTGVALSNITTDDSLFRISGFTTSAQQSLNSIIFSTEGRSTITYSDRNGDGDYGDADETNITDAPTQVTTQDAAISNITLNASDQVTGYRDTLNQSLNSITFTTLKDATITYDGSGNPTSTYTRTTTGQTSDGTSIISVTLNGQDLVSGYTQRRAQSLALIQFNNDRQISNITYDASNNVTGQDPEAISSTYTAKSGVVLSNIQVSSSLKVTAYRLTSNQPHYDAAFGDDLRVVYDVSNITYDANNKITSLSLDYFQVSDIVHDAGGDIETVFSRVRITTPFALSGVRAEIYEGFGIPVVDLDTPFTADHLTGIKRILQNMYPSYLLDELTIIVARASDPDDPPYVGALTWYNNVVEFVKPDQIENSSTGAIELYLAHEIAHVIDYREPVSFNTTLRNKVQTLYTASGQTGADVINYAEVNYSAPNPIAVPSWPTYGMQNRWEDFASMVESWWWNTTNLLNRGIQQFNDLANSILLEKSLVVAELFSYVVDSLEYTYTYTLQDTVLGDFVRTGSRIIRDIANKIIQIGDTIIPAI